MAFEFENFDIWLTYTEKEQVLADMVTPQGKWKLRPPQTITAFGQSIVLYSVIKTPPHTEKLRNIIVVYDKINNLYQIRVHETKFDRLKEKKENHKKPKKDKPESKKTKLSAPPKLTLESPSKGWYIVTLDGVQVYPEEGKKTRKANAEQYIVENT